MKNVTTAVPRHQQIIGKNEKCNYRRAPASTDYGEDEKCLYSRAPARWKCQCRCDRLFSGMDAIVREIAGVGPVYGDMNIVGDGCDFSDAVHLQISAIGKFFFMGAIAII